MAVTKTSTFAGNISFEANVGTVTDVQVQMTVTLGNDGVPANLRYVAAVSIWANLTAQQQVNFQNLYTRLVQLAATVDPPIP